ncbi:hypothetical protein BCR33DRAFT_723223 [Rhizoclosmatium globosum]|uniref:MYND-type domain-containing protein n=1 Tax=Rhizoclosmatium globosum TaxID=329046 RepID=A0A1Y2BFA8_9FUNG|nr:hypothetical protein BCR33DRAFT_723223 [Rhizoclosmatium globosum]|eukprot:ORY33240.1 hypothetical protein BCR33DRAFT_723223 [Rhizoclosmatium globosum]
MEDTEIDQLVDDIVKLRIADPTLSIKQVHAIYIEQGKDYSHAKVKKAFSKATRIVNPDLPQTPKKKDSALEKIQPLADSTMVHKRIDTTELLKEAVQHITDEKKCLQLAAQSFLIDSKLPDLNRIDEGYIQKLRDIAGRVTKDEVSTIDQVANGYVLTAGIHLAMQSFPKASTNLTEAINIMKSSTDKLKLASIYSFRSSVFAGWGRLFESSSDLDTALELNPKCTKSRAYRCILRHRKKEVEDAIEDAQMLYHLNPDGSFFHSDPCYIVAINLFAQRSLDAGKFWLELGDRFMYQYPTDKHPRYFEAHQLYEDLKRNAPRKVFELPLRAARQKGPVGELDRIGDTVFQKMLEDSFMRTKNKSKTKNPIDMKPYIVHPSKMDTSIPLLPEDGDQTGLVGLGAQALREAWAEGMDFEPLDGMPLLHKKCFLGDIKWMKENQEWRMLELRVSAMRFTPLMCVIQEKGAQINARCVIGNTALFYTCGLGCNEKTLEIERLLLEKGAAVNIQNRFGCTAVMAPVMGGYGKAISLLMEYGCNPKIPDYEGSVPLEIARSRPTIYQTMSKSEAASMRARADPTDTSIEKIGCRVCGSSERQLKYCPACLVTAYCSTSCQSADWKLHKGACRKDNVVTVTLSTDEAAKNRPIRTVKIQANGLGPHLVYDKERSFTKAILPSDANYSRITAIIRQDGVLGAKGYFRAIVEGNTMKVLVSELLPPCDW